MRRLILDRCRTRLARERGTALAELAIVMPLLMLLLLAMVDFGKAFNTWIDETHLANEGARLAAVNYSAPACGDPNPNVCLARYIQQTADFNELKNGRPTSDSYAPAQSATQVCISYPQNTANSPATQGLIGDPVQVTVSVNYQWLRYVSGKLNLGTTPITGKATMRLEQPAPSSAATIRSCS